MSLLTVISNGLDGLLVVVVVVVVVVLGNLFLFSAIGVLWRSGLEVVDTNLCIWNTSLAYLGSASIKFTARFPRLERSFFHCFSAIWHFFSRSHDLLYCFFCPFFKLPNAISPAALQSAGPKTVHQQCS